MGLILSEPIKKVVEVLKILTKMSVEDAKITQNALAPWPFLQSCSPTPGAHFRPYRCLCHPLQRECTSFIE
jgi:hypothetical protein